MTEATCTHPFTQTIEKCWTKERNDGGLNCYECEHCKVLVEIESTCDLQEECRCCGKYVPGWYAYGDNSEFNIHTMCIAKHWGKHARGVNHSRCKEFKKK